jgi:sugar lactone lactonase YvrE
MRTLVALASVVAALAAAPRPQGHGQPVNDLPNPYTRIENHFKLAEGRWWESSSAVDIDVDGRSVWVADRCAADTCAGSRLNPILLFDQAGNLVRRFGERMFNLPHGIHVDREGNVWVTDAQGPDGRDRDRNGKGHVVYKFSPEGRLLLTLGTPGVAGDGTGALLNEPCDVVTAPNGDIFVADGHGGEDPATGPWRVARIVRFARDGRFIASWGRPGSAPGEFRTPHGLSFDSRGRLFVADRGNNRLQIFEQDGRFLDEWRQFGRVSGIYIDSGDVLYAADSESNDETHAGWKPGIRIGSARDGKVTYFIPVLEPNHAGTSGAEGVAADALGRVFTAEVGGGALALKQYIRLP